MHLLDVRDVRANTGAHPGDAVVQPYLRQDFTIPTRPVNELKDFARVRLSPGASGTVEMILTPGELVPTTPPAGLVYSRVIGGCAILRTRCRCDRFPAAPSR